ncbi:hypothetical protein ACFLUM_03725 [Chloroflexota bacterium]
MPTPEEKARQKIDSLLKAAGWRVQDRNRLNLGAARGVAVREFPLETGFADYLLFVDRKAAGVIEAKPEGTSLSGVAEQSTAYLTGLPADIPHGDLALSEPTAYTYMALRPFPEGEVVSRGQATPPLQGHVSASVSLMWFWVQRAAEAGGKDE